MNDSLPKLPKRFLQWYCKELFVESIQGDLEEQFEEDKINLGTTRAKWRFTWNVIRFCRPGITKSFEGSRRLNNYGMFKNYFKVGYRNLLRHKGYALINTGGLTLGLTVVILISLWIKDELTFDRYHQNYDRIAQVMQHRTVNGDKRTQESIPMPLGDELRKEYGSDFEYVVMSSRHRDYTLSVNKNSIVRNGGYMEPDAAKLFSLKMRKGSWDNLENPNAIFLSNSTFKALFGDSEKLGQTLKINDRLNAIVRGIYEDLPYNSQFQGLSFIASWDAYVASSDRLQEAREHPNWSNASHLLFAQLAENADLNRINDKVKLVKYNKLPEEDRGFNPEIFLHPMKDWRLRSNWENGVKKGGFITYVWLFGIVGIFVLILACINFMNLSTASSQRRAKEVGIRKTMGSRGIQLIIQFLSESFIITFLSFAISLILVYLTLPLFNNLADKHISFPLFDLSFWVSSVFFLLIISILAGSYPAFYLSSFQPIKVLKGTFQTNFSSGLFRKVLVVIQFSASVVLIIATLGVEKQIKHAKNRPLGYDHSNLLSISMNAPAFYTTHELLRTELVRRNVIEEMALSSSPLTQVRHNAAGYEWEGKDPSFNPQLAHIRVTPNYGKAIDWEMIEGRDFMDNYASDSLSFILNETAVSHLDLEDPIGKTIRWDDKEFRIIGVSKDLLMESPFDPIKPTIYEINNGERTGWMTVKLNPKQPINESLEIIQEVFEANIPNVQTEYLFVDNIHSRKFSQIERIDKLSEIFAILAIFISCLGLFGLTTFMAEQRSKEMGIRKVLGASVRKIWQIMSGEFFLLVGISCLVATPVSYILLDNWLHGFNYRTELGGWIFIYSCLGAMAIALITISFQSIKAASANPIESLKDE